MAETMFYDNLAPTPVADAPDMVEVERVYTVDESAFAEGTWSDIVAIYERLPGGCRHTSGGPMWFGRNEERPPFLWASAEPSGIQVYGVLRRTEWDAWDSAFRRELRQAGVPFRWVGDHDDAPRVGEVVEASVVRVTSYGAWVQLASSRALRGLVLLHEIHWGRVRQVEEHFEVGQRIDAKVRGMNEHEGVVLLSTKHLRPDPWKVRADALFVGAVMDGCVTCTADYGVFVEVFEHVEGLVHCDDLEGNPSDYVSGDRLRVRVLAVQPDERRLCMGQEPDGSGSPASKPLRRIRTTLRGDGPSDGDDMTGDILKARDLKPLSNDQLLVLAARMLHRVRPWRPDGSTQAWDAAMADLLRACSGEAAPLSLARHASSVRTAGSKGAYGDARPEAWQSRAQAAAALVCAAEATQQLARKERWKKVVHVGKHVASVFAVQAHAGHGELADATTAPWAAARADIPRIAGSPVPTTVVELEAMGPLWGEGTPSWLRP